MANGKILSVKNEIIKTKEGDELNATLKFTHRGPIVNRFKNEKEMPLSIHWLGNEMSNEIRTVYLLNRAKNWTDFRDAVKTFISVSQNIVYADVARKYRAAMQRRCSYPHWKRN